MLLQDHGDLVQGGVAGAFPQAVDRYADGPGPGFDGRQGIGRGQAHVVMAVELQFHVGDGRSQ